MDNAVYATLTRQSGLWSEMRTVATNIANANTTGFRAEGIVYSEFVRALGQGVPSLSMAAARVRDTDLSQGGMAMTGGPFDLAIEGEGFFLVETAGGQRLTRAGAFAPDQDGNLVTPEGHRVLDSGGAPVFVPPGQGDITIAADGTISAGGLPLGQIGVFVPEDPNGLSREGGVLFAAAQGVVPVESPRILQGALEQSNVDPILEIARMIEVQRAYELGQGFLQREDERMRALIQSVKG